MGVDYRLRPSPEDVRSDLRAAYSSGRRQKALFERLLRPFGVLLAALFAIQRITLGPDAPPAVEWLLLLALAGSAFATFWFAVSTLLTSKTFLYFPLVTLRALREALPAPVRSGLIVDEVCGLVGGQVTTGRNEWSFSQITPVREGAVTTVLAPFNITHTAESAFIVLAILSARYESGHLWMGRFATLSRRPGDWVAAAMILQAKAGVTFDTRLMTTTGMSTVLSATGYSAQGWPAGVQPLADMVSA